tara:strand:- start:524 stop:640 length:117 start_codon:yes stop_codon:yes gene_type:complete
MNLKDRLNFIKLLLGKWFYVALAIDAAIVVLVLYLLLA